MDYPITNQLAYIKKNVINVLLRNANADPFKIPVNPELLQIPQYPRIIKSPMDFGTIKSKLDKRMYQSSADCKADFMDVFINCYVFNEPGSIFVDMAMKLEALFKRKMRSMPVPESYATDSTTSAVSHTSKRLNISSKNVKPTINPIATSMPLVTAPKRPLHDESLTNQPNFKRQKLNLDFKQCKHILQNLMSKKYNDTNKYFLQPVDVEGLKLHDYYDIVKYPMDLNTVKTKLFDLIYTTNQEFADDVKQIFRNCYLYNPEGHEVHRCGKLLENVFTKLYQNAFNINHSSNVVHSVNNNISKNSHNSNNKISFGEEVKPLIHKILQRQNEIEGNHKEILRRYQDIQQIITIIHSDESLKLCRQHYSNTLSNINMNNNLHLGSNIAQENNNIDIPLSSHHSVYHSSSSSSVSSISCNQNSQQIPAIQSPQKHLSRKSSSQSLSLDSALPVESKQSEKSPPTSQSQKTEEIQPTQESTTTTKPSPPNNKSKSPTPTKPSTVTPPTAPNPTIDQSKQCLKALQDWISTLGPEMNKKIRAFINKSEQQTIIELTLSNLRPVTTRGLYKMMYRSKEYSDSIEAQLPEFTGDDLKKLSIDVRQLKEKYSMRVFRIYKTYEVVNTRDGECELDFQKMKKITLHKLREFIDKCLDKAAQRAKSNHPNDSSTDDSDDDDDEEDEDDSDEEDDTSSTTTSSSASSSTSSTSSDAFSTAKSPNEVIPVTSRHPTTTTTTISNTITSATTCVEDTVTNSESIISIATSKTNLLPVSVSMESAVFPTPIANSTSVNMGSVVTGNKSTDVVKQLFKSKSEDMLVTAASSAGVSIKTSEASKIPQADLSRLSDSSDDYDDDYDDDDAAASSSTAGAKISSLSRTDNIKNNSNAGSLSFDKNSSTGQPYRHSSNNNVGLRRPPKYTNLWNKNQLNKQQTALNRKKGDRIHLGKDLNALGSMGSSKLGGGNSNSTVSTAPKLHESLKQILQDAQAHENVKKHEEELRQERQRQEEEHKRQNQIRMQQLTDSRKKLVCSEQQKKAAELEKIKERAALDERQRKLEIPEKDEREDYHQMLCDFEFNMDRELLMKLVHLDAKQVHLY